MLQCLGTAETDDADIFLARAEIAIVADADFRCDPFCNFICELCSCEVSEVVVVRMGPGSELEPAKCDEVLSGNV